MFKTAKIIPQKGRVIAYFTLSIALIFVLFSVYVIKTSGSFTLSQKKLNVSVLGSNEDANKDLVAEKTFWEKFLIKNPQYITGYIRLIEIEKTLGNDLQAEAYYKKAFDINPNSEELKGIK